MTLRDLRRFAPLGLYLAGLAAVVAIALFIVYRTFNLPIQISLGVAVVGLALHRHAPRQGRQSRQAILHQRRFSAGRGRATELVLIGRNLSARDTGQWQALGRSGSVRGCGLLRPGGRGGDHLGDPERRCCCAASGDSFLLP